MILFAYGSYIYEMKFIRLAHTCCDIEIETVWRFRKEGSPQTAVVMLGILNEIRKTGKLTSAAEHAHLSYRHVWNLVEQWSDFFGVPLVETHRGKGTRLTAFGEKLVWAGERMQARLGPQLENLAQELATEIKPFLHQRPSVIRVHASHGFAVSKLRELLDREPGIGVDLRYVSNQNSLVSLAQGACDLSGVHLPRGELRAQGIRACKEWLDPREDRVISFVTREMGLMVKRGNPLKITSLEDLVERKARFVNRDHDSGTRLLFDQLLALHGIDEAKIMGGQQMEFTHAAVAAYVASGMADASFGVEAAARQFGLDFIRILTEDYFFVCKRAFLETEPMQRMLDIMKGKRISRGHRHAARIYRRQHRRGQHREGISGKHGCKPVKSQAIGRKSHWKTNGFATVARVRLIKRPYPRVRVVRSVAFSPSKRRSLCASDQPLICARPQHRNRRLAVGLPACCARSGRLSGDSSRFLCLSLDAGAGCARDRLCASRHSRTQGSGA